MSSDESAARDERQYALMRDRVAALRSGELHIGKGISDLEGLLHALDHASTEANASPRQKPRRSAWTKRLSMFALQRGTDGYQGVPPYWWVAKCRDGTNEVGIGCAPDDMPAIETLLRSATSP